MKKYLAGIFLFNACSQAGDSDRPVSADSVSVTSPKPIVQYEKLKETLFLADSVILLSHHSPNMPVINAATGKYYPKSIPFIENGRINYLMSVQERKQLNKSQIKELADILTLPAVDDSIRAMCFQPRNAVVLFKNEQMSCFDFCFDCFGVGSYGDFGSELIMNGEKYNKLYAFFKKHGFKYEME
jgi:hypothetical protein